MKTPRAVLVTMALLLPGAGDLAAQSPVQAPDTVFLASEHSPVVAGVVEWLLPTAGFAYGGDWTRGFVPNVVRTASFIGFMKTGGDSNRCEGACPAWGVALVAGTVWAIVDAVDTARDHNARVRRLVAGLSLEPAPGGGAAVGLRVMP